VILGDGAYGDNTELRAALEERELSYVLDVRASPPPTRGRQPSTAEARGSRPPARHALPQDPSSLKQLALAAGKNAAVTVTARGSAGR